MKYPVYPHSTHKHSRRNFHFHREARTQALDLSKECVMRTLTHTNSTLHHLLKLYQYLRIVSLQLVLDEWAHKMLFSLFPCNLMFWQSKKKWLLLWWDLNKFDRKWSWCHVWRSGEVDSVLQNPPQSIRLKHLWQKTKFTTGSSSVCGWKTYHHRWCWPRHHFQ